MARTHPSRLGARAALRLALALVTLGWGALGAGPAGAGPDTTLSGMSLIEALRAGGYSLYFRHAPTDWSSGDRVDAPGDWLSCDPSKIRQLSEEGRASARAVGGAMRALGIPVGRVLASPYCRTVETARLLGVGAVHTTEDVVNLRVAEHFGGRAAIAARARVRLSDPPPAGTNTVLVAHGNVVREATGVYPGEGECAVFRPGRHGQPAYVGSLTPEEWLELAGGAP